MQAWLSFFPDTSHKHPIHTKIVVEMPSSGSANEKEDKSAMVEIAAANKYGMIFFISGRL
ncbi:hypothetical protein [Pedobacter sp.]|uniref:hypothetical protein n=1 Tax=Pedobacter sp. TaxID=1411316 RepID=UPI003BA9512F